MKIGKASYGYVKKNYYKLKDGESVFRILPPLGDLAEEGKWSFFWNVHYGYKNTKGQLRAFQSPLVKNRKSKMIEVADPALDRINALKAEFEKAKLAKNGPLIEKLDKLVGQKGQYNLDNNHYLNVVDQQGNIGVLKIRHRAKLALDATIKRLREQGVDPLSVDNGRFFVFRRSGMGLDTSFQVDVLTQKRNIPGVGDVLQEVIHTVDAALIGRLSKEAAQLDKLFKRPSSEEVARIVREGATAVDEILDSETATASAEESFDDTGDYEEPASGATQAAASAPAVQAVPAPAPVQTVQVAPVQTPAPVTQPKTTAQAVNEQSDADFLKSLGL